MKDKLVFLSVAVASMGPLLFGLSLGFTGQTELTMNIITDPKEGEVSPSAESNLAILSGSEQSLFGTIVTLGALVGALVSGPVSQALGRKFIISVASPIFIFSWMWIALASTGTELVAARFFVGIAVGFVSFGVPTYIGEISPKHLRGALGSINQVGITLGILLAYVLGWLIRTDGGLGEQFNGVFCDWRKVAFSYIAPSIVLAFILFFPESPRYLASKGRYEEASIALKSLRGESQTSDINEELDNLRTLSDESGHSKGTPVIGSLKKCRWQLFIVVMLMLFQQCSGINAVVFFQTSIFQAASMDNKEALAMSVMSVMFVVTCIFVMVMDKLGRKVLLITGSIGMSIAAMILGIGLSLAMGDDTKGNPLYGYVALTGAYLYVTAFSMGVGACPWILATEILPDEARSSGSSIATAFNWFFGFIVTFLFKEMDTQLKLRENGLQYAFFVFMCICACLALFCHTLLPETRNKTFEEIQDYFKERKRRIMDKDIVAVMNQ